MSNSIVCIRDGEVKTQLPLSVLEIKPDGTIWSKTGQPVLCPKPEDKDRIQALAREKNWSAIPEDCFGRIGTVNGAEIMWHEDWLKHPAYLQKLEKRLRTAKIHLSSRGWGDLPCLEWVGDITRPSQEILTECAELVANSHDLDERNIADEDILLKIIKAKSDYEDRVVRDKKVKQALADREELRKSAKMETKLETIEDEGGVTVVAYHTVSLSSGSQVKFIDRNVFDFGRVINPDFEIVFGTRGGLRSGEYWQTFDKEKGWVDVRKLTEDEKAAFAYVLEFGYHAKDTIRM